MAFWLRDWSDTFVQSWFIQSYWHSKNQSAKYCVDYDSELLSSVITFYMDDYGWKITQCSKSKLSHRQPNEPCCPSLTSTFWKTSPDFSCRIFLSNSYSLFKCQFTHLFLQEVFSQTSQIRSRHPPYTRMPMNFFITRSMSASWLDYKL